MTENTTPAAAGTGPDGLDMTEVHRQLAGLYDAVARATHFERVVAAIIAKVGPVDIRPSEYDAAPVGELTVFESLALFGPDDPDGPMTFALEKHTGDIEGLITSEPQVIAALEATDGRPTADQARAVLTALGLPVRPKD